MASKCLHSRFTDEKLRFNEVKIEKPNVCKTTVLVSGRARERTKASDLQLCIFKKEYFLKCVLIGELRYINLNFFQVQFEIYN